MLQTVILWVVVLTALYTDLRERKIYNAVVVPGMFLGLILNGVDHGWSGLLFGGKGLLVGMAIFFIPFILGGFGAGDVKLMGVVGALMGPGFVLLAALGTALAGGVVAVIILLKQGRLLQALKRIWYVIVTLFTSKNHDSLKRLDQADYDESFPYGIAIAIGVLLATLMG